MFAGLFRFTSAIPQCGEPFASQYSNGHGTGDSGSCLQARVAMFTWHLLSACSRDAKRSQLLRHISITTCSIILWFRFSCPSGVLFALTARRS